MKKLLLVTAALLLSTGYSMKARADWGNMFCDIMDQAHSGGLVTAVNQYNRDEEGDRNCLTFIRFFDDMTVDLPNGLEITQAPPAGYTKGTSIRRCFKESDGLVFNGQPYSEAGCPSDITNTAVVLDFSGYEADGGDCPIRIKSGANISIQRVKIIAPNPAKAICSYNTKTALPVEDQNNGYVWIHDVTIVASPDQPNPIDTDGDGVIDDDDNCDNVSNPDQANFDGDSQGDACDSDDDNDGVSDGQDDCEETPAGINVNSSGCPDEDGDGIDDDHDLCDNTPEGTTVDENGCPTTGPGADQDGDGVTDATDLCDHDSTGNLCDSTNLEACFGNTVDDVCNGVPVGSSVACSETEDMDNDGVGNRCDSDIDGDTLPNGSDPDPYDKDADNDGVNDNLDACPLNNERTELPCVETPTNPSETDPDGDGLTTTLENDIGTDPNNPDTDADGSLDGVDCFPTDAAQQACGGTVVVVDPDSDNDGICDGAVSDTDPVTGNPCTPNALGAGDNCPLVANADQADTNGDGIGDACAPGMSASVDGDGDGLPDDLEESVFGTDPTRADTDGDGLSDGEEVKGPTYQGGRGPLDPDVDADGICDGPASVSDINGDPVCNSGPSGTGDNCPIVENPGQEDGDGDGVGDVCQGDMDGDSRPDAEDNCPFVRNEDQKDADEDGIGDACDIDLSSSDGQQGCGCRIDGKSSPAGFAGLLPFLAMALPMVMLRVARRKREV